MFGLEEALEFYVDCIWNVLDEMLWGCTLMPNIWMTSVPQIRDLYTCPISFMKKFRDTAGKISPDIREMATGSFRNTEFPVQYREAMEKQ